MRVLYSLAVVLLVGVFGWAQGSLNLRRAPLDIEGVVTSLCQGNEGEAILPEDIPHYPGGKGMTLSLDNGMVLHYLRAPASLQSVLAFYRSGFARKGWTEAPSTIIKDPSLLFFRKGQKGQKVEKECLMSLSAKGTGDTDVVIITK